MESIKLHRQYTAPSKTHTVLEKKQNCGHFPARMTSQAHTVWGSVSHLFVRYAQCCVRYARVNQVSPAGADITHTHPVLASQSWEAGNTTTDNKATSGATSFQFINSPHTVCAIAHNSCFLNGCTQMVLWVSNGLSLYFTDATYTYSTLWKQHCMSFHSYHNYAISSKV